MFLLSRLFGLDRARGPATAEVRRLVAATRFELVPMKGVDEAIEALPESSSVSVTCSPAKGIPATLDLTVRLLDLGHHPIPHISARMVEGPDEVFKLAAWFREHGLRDLFVVGGDAEQPHGPYADGLTFLRDLLAHDHGLERIGVPAYPDGHPFIDRSVLRDALHAKQALITEAGVERRCLDPDVLRRRSHPQLVARGTITRPDAADPPRCAGRGRPRSTDADGCPPGCGDVAALPQQEPGVGRADARPGRLRPDRPRARHGAGRRSRSASSGCTRSRSTASPTPRSGARRCCADQRR